MIIAYEPIWAIGSGEIVDPKEAEKVFNLIHQALIDMYPLTIVSNNVRIVYGGSVDPDNANSFISLKIVDGFLVGGASLSADKFKEIVGLLWFYL